MVACCPPKVAVHDIVLHPEEHETREYGEEQELVGAEVGADWTADADIVLSPGRTQHC